MMTNILKINTMGKSNATVPPSTRATVQPVAVYKKQTETLTIVLK